MPISRFSLVLFAATMAACSASPRPDPVARAAADPQTVQGPERKALATAAEPDVVASVAPSPVVVEQAPASIPAAQPAQPAQEAKPIAVPVVEPRVATPAKPPLRSQPSTPSLSKKVSMPGSAPEPVTENSAEGSAARISGQLILAAGSGQTIATGEMSRAAIYFLPESGTATAKPGRFRIYTHNKEFEPDSLVIPLGSTIVFPNQDEILHNVFSVTPQSSFDLGIYGEGKSAEYTFKHAGLVLINCNVHHAMQANVLVVDTPYYTTPDANGRFNLADLPTGRGRLMVWHPRANVREMAIELPSSAPIELSLVLTKPNVAEHLNKDRKAY